MAACRGRTEIMFDRARRRQAQSLCSGCPVQQVCLWTNLRDEVADDRHGMAGGMTPGERGTLAARLSPTVVQAALDAALAAREVRNRRAGVVSDCGLSLAVQSSGARMHAASEGAAGAHPGGDELVAVVAQAFGLSSGQICGRNRSPGVVEARQVAMHLLREAHGLSYSAIGKEVGDRDPTTVRHALKRVRARMAESATLRRHIELLVARLTGTQSETAGPLWHPTDDADAVVEEVAREFGVSTEQLCGLSRCREVVQARHVAMYVLREDRGLSFPVIGRALGGRDHTTVLRAVERMRTSIARSGPIPGVDRVLERLATAPPTAA